MKRVRSAFQLFQQKIGNLQLKRIKVCYKVQFKVFITIFFIFNLVIQSLIALVNDPEPEHPLRAELAEEFLKDKKKFMKNADEFTKKNSEKRPE